MNLKKLFLIGLICAFMAPTNAFADGKVYFAGSVGVLFAEDATISSQDATLNAISRAVDAEITSKTGVAIKVAVGMELMPQVRGEVEYAHSSVDVDQVTSTIGNADLTGGVDINALMFNAIYDFDIKSSWTPYLGGGIGVAWIGSDDFGGFGVVTTNETVSDFAYQVMAGVAYEVSDNTKLNVGYRYFGSGDADFPLLSASINAHALEFGVRYSF